MISTLLTSYSDFSKDFHRILKNRTLSFAIMFQAISLFSFVVFIEKPVFKSTVPPID